MPATKGRRALVVAGMHRSGTSATAGALHLLGASLPRVVMPAIPGNNDTGFFEPSRIVEIHDELLATAGSSWHDPSPLPEAWFRSPTARAFGQRLGAAYLEEYGDSVLTVLKDPRVCRFLPLWRDILASLSVTPAFVIPFRHPVEVAASLSRRDGFSSSKSQVLWLQHLLLAEHASRGCPRGFVAYEELLADPRTALARLAGDLAIDWPSPIEEVLPQVEQFLARRHHHNRAFSQDGPRPGDATDLVVQTYSILQEVVGSPRPDQEEALNEIRASYLRSAQLQGPLIRSLEGDLGRVTQEFEGRKAELAQSISDRDAKILLLVEEARTREAESARRIEEALAAVAERDQQALRASEAAAALEKELHTALSTVAERDQALVAANDELRRQSAEAAALEAKVRDLEAQVRSGMTSISEIRAATSWRVTAPLRALGRLANKIGR